MNKNDFAIKCIIRQLETYDKEFKEHEEKAEFTRDYYYTFGIIQGLKNSYYFLTGKEYGVSK